MLKELAALAQQAEKKIATATSEAEIINIESHYLGKKGLLTSILKNLKSLSPEEKAETGRHANILKKSLEEQIAQQKKTIAQKTIAGKLDNEWIDVTVPGQTVHLGHIHPLFQVQAEVEQIFSQMGFAIMDGPEVESEYYNFEGLNIPSWHPARDMQDTFFLKQEADKQHGRLVLRTHTSPVQVRTMEKYGAPLRIIVPGRVFRNEATDASHEHTFDQVEGLLIDKNISLSHLKGVMQEFLSRLFGEKIKVRFRPGYFPFVEPGLELDFYSEKIGWLEFMGAGMVHPNVLKAGGIDPEVYQGWAFGFGLTRLVMMKYDITDIRLLTSGDLRFSEQF